MLKLQLYWDLIHNAKGLQQLADCTGFLQFMQCLRQVLKLEHESDAALLALLECGNRRCFKPQLELLNQFWIPVSYKELTQEVLWLPALGRPVQSYFADYVTEVQGGLLASLLKPKTRLNHLLQLADEVATSKPAGFIFHLSRCGSTLVSRSIATSESCRVVAESELLTAVLQDQQLDQEQRNSALKLMLALQGKLRGKEQHLVVKWNAWDLCFLQQVKQLYPRTPLVFLSRQPLDILASHQKSAGWHMVPLDKQLSLFGLPLAQCAGNLLHYQQLVLHQLMQWILDSAELELALIVDYQQLPQAVETQILPFLGLFFSSVEIQMMKQSQQQYSKNPQQLFQPDNWKLQYFDEKQSIELFQQLSPLYQQLVAFI